MNFQTKIRPILAAISLGFLSLFPTDLEAQNRQLIGRQLQQSVSPYSIIVTDASNNQAYTVPGMEGYVLTVSSGIPTWASVGGLVTADNGVSVSGGVVQLGHAASGSGASDFTADRYLYFDTFDFFWEDSGGSALWYDNSNDNFTIGNSTTAHSDGVLWVYNSGGAVNPTGAPHLVVQHSNLSGNSANIALISGTAGTGTITFDDSDLTDLGSIAYNHTTNALAFYTNSTLHSTVVSDGSWNWSNYGVGTFPGTAAYFLAVDASGNVIEETLSGTTDNIYTADGTLGANRTVSMDDKSLTFSSSNSASDFNVDLWETELIWDAGANTFELGDRDNNNDGTGLAFDFDGGFSALGSYYAAPGDAPLLTP